MFQTTTPVLTIENTTKFIRQVDLACKLLDVEFLTEVVQKFKLEHLEDTFEFLKDAKEKLSLWQEEQNGSRVHVVEEFNTRCIACVYGKKVNGYRIQYSTSGPEGARIHYVRAIAVNFQIVEDRLTDFGWCNAFLDKEEMIEFISRP